MDKEDEGYEDDDWQHLTHQSGEAMEVPLRADRRWFDISEQAKNPDQGRCLGIRCNIWARARRWREITHHLRGGGKTISVGGR